MKMVLSLIALAFSAAAVAGPDHNHKVVVPKEFENMKALIGTWEGKTKMEGKDIDVKVVYELTSNGTAIVEKLGPGSPNEMVTVYSANKKGVNMTHYCAAGNQPEMKLKKSDGKVFTFEMNGTKGLNSPKEEHMHALTLTLADDTLKQEWTNFKNGKKADSVTFDLTRK